MRVILFPIIIGLAASWAVAQRRGANNAPDLAALEKRITALESRVGRLEYASSKNLTAELDVSDPKGYQRLTNDSGTFLVSLAKVEKYLDGYKITISIGNITTATFNGFDLTLKSGTKEPPFSDAWISWYKTLKTKTETYTQDLKPGLWNDVEIIIIPASPYELGYLQLKIATNKITLYRNTD
jgi:hypothetical protein